MSRPTCWGFTASVGSELRRHRFRQPISYHFDLYVPEAAPQPLLVCLHGYGQNKETALTFGQTVRRDWSIAALQAPHAHHLRHTLSSEVGFSWVSLFEPAEDIANHHSFVRHVIEQAFAEGLSDRPRAFLFGFSQAVSLNYRFARAFPDYVCGVVAVAGAAPSDWQEQAVRLAVPVLHIAPQEDEVYPLQKTRLFRAVLENSVSDLTWLEPPGRHRVPRSSYPVIREWLEARVG